MFIHNDWYIAAWGSEIKGRPFARTILNQPVVSTETVLAKSQR